MARGGVRGRRGRLVPAWGRIPNGGEPRRASLNLL